MTFCADFLSNDVVEFLKINFILLKLYKHSDNQDIKINLWDF